MGRMCRLRRRFTSNKVAITIVTLVSRRSVPHCAHTRDIPVESSWVTCPRSPPRTFVDNTLYALRDAGAFPYRCLRSSLRPGLRESFRQTDILLLGAFVSDEDRCVLPGPRVLGPLRLGMHTRERALGRLPSFRSWIGAL